MSFIASGVPLQALKNHAPDEWSNLPDLQQKRASYYQALVAPNRTLIGQTQVCREGHDLQPVGTDQQQQGYHLRKNAQQVIPLHSTAYCVSRLHQHAGPMITPSTETVHLAL